MQYISTKFEASKEKKLLFFWLGKDFPTFAGGKVRWRTLVG